MSPFLMTVLLLFAQESRPQLSVRIAAEESAASREIASDSKKAKPAAKPVQVAQPWPNPSSKGHASGKKAKRSSSQGKPVGR